MNEVITYRVEEENIFVNVQDGKTYLSSKQMQQLFEMKQPSVARTLKQLKEDGLLSVEMTQQIVVSIPHQGGLRTRSVTLYPMSVWLYIGMRARSPKAIKFQRWAADILERYTKGTLEPRIPEEKITGWMYLRDWATSQNADPGWLRELAREGQFPRAFKEEGSVRWQVYLPARLPEVYFGPRGRGAHDGPFSDAQRAMIKLPVLVNQLEALITRGQQNLLESNYETTKSE